jgi:hypothetical protein
MKSDMVGLLSLIFAIELFMWVWLGRTTTTTVLFDLFLNGIGGDFMAWLDSNIMSVVGAGAAVTIIIGSFMTNKSDFIIYAGFAALFASYISVFINLKKDLTTLFNSMMSLNGGGLIAIAIIAPIIILYIIAILRLWRGIE